MTTLVSFAQSSNMISFCSESSDDEQPKPKPMSGLTNQPPMLICVDEPTYNMDLELMVPPSSLTTRKKQV